MMQEFMGDKRVKILMAVVLVFVVIALGAYANYALMQARQIDRGMSTISVMGTSEQFLKPDIATFTFSAVAEEKDATAAQNKSAEAVNAITAYLKEKGIEEKDIKTEAYILDPKYDYIQGVCTQWGGCPPGKQTLAGYIVNQTVSVKVRKIETAGDLISGVGEKGATYVSGLSFTIDDMEKALEGVRAEAIADAKDKAGRLAQSLGVRLGKLQSYYESTPGQPMPYGYGGAMMEKSMDAMAQNAAPIMTPGENKVVSNVTLVYELR